MPGSPPPGHRRLRSSSSSSNDTVRAASPCRPVHDAKPTSGQPTSELATLWVHEENFSKDEVLINSDTFSHVSVAPGDLVQIVAVKVALDVRDFEQSPDLSATGNSTLGDLESASKDPKTLSSVPGPGPGGIVDVDGDIRYVFIAKALPAEIKAKHPSLQVSLCGTIAGTFGFRTRSQVVVSKVERQDCTASHVELIFRDEYMARSDMWRLVNSELAGKTIYKGQKILFLGTVKALIKCIYVHGQKVSAAYFSGTTVPVFRSESARYVLFIQMSKEMWDFDSEGSGEILFNRVVNGFLPDLFKRWAELDARHLVSIVMFGRLEYGESNSTSLIGIHESLQSSAPFPAVEQSSSRDFYRVVVTDMASGQWTAILNELKKEFRIFLRDVSLQEVYTNNMSEHGNNVDAQKPRARIYGRPSTALRGNILEAINIASTQFASDYVDRDLVRTGISIVVITPGSGVFEVDRDLLCLTSANLTNNGIGIDLVCLSKMPLHSVPLFKYRRSGKSGDGTLLVAQRASLAVLHSVAGSWSSRMQGLSPSASSACGSAPRSLSRFTSLAYPHSLDDFYYGIPQWIDLSYWSSEPNASHGSRNYGVDGGKSYHGSAYAKPFVPRLRMYELQMMGIMELGLANISIPYMCEGWPVNRIGSGADSRGQRSPVSSNLRHRTNTRHRKSTSVTDGRQTGLLAIQARQQGEFYDRMDDYDGDLFKTRTRTECSSGTSSNKRLHGKPSMKSIREHRPKSVSQMSVQTEGSDKRDHHAVQQSDARLNKPEPVLTPQRPKVQPGPLTPASRISRSISYALRGLAPPPRAVASTEINIQNVQAEPSIKGKTPSRAFTGSPDGPKFSTPTETPQKNRSSLETESSEKSDSGASGSDGRPSQPIKIGAAGRLARDHARLANQLLSRVEGSAMDLQSTHSTNSNVVVSTLLSDEAFDEKVDFSPEVKNGESNVQATKSKTLSPWITNVNPSNPTKGYSRAARVIGRWQHLYPRAPKTSGMKWRSLCTPASVPLTTEEFPTKDELETQYEQRSYMVSQDASKELSEIPKNRESLVHQMLALRFAHGYQLVVGQRLADAFGTQSYRPLTFTELETVTDDGVSIFMSMGNSVQRLSFSNQTEIHVTKFVRKAHDTESKPPQYIVYRPSIRTILSSKYSVREMSLAGFSEEYPWKLADHHLAGRADEGTDPVQKLRFWRARFVLIPVEPPASARRPLQAMSEDNEEEIHLLGIRALTQLWQRYRYIPPEGPRFKSTTIRHKDQNPLEINFQTLNPSEVVATELDKFSAAEDAGEGRTTQLLPDSEMLERVTCTLPKLAQIMQGDKGIEIMTRRWHLQLHFHCFKGDDFTNWLTLNFKDIDTREDAVEFGNELMQHGLFQHANKRHNFRDGNYFYQIDQDYRAYRTPRTPRPEVRTSWFPTSRRSDRSVPSTPLADTMLRDSPLGSRSRSGSSSGQEGQEPPTSAAAKSSVEKKRMSITLSKMMRLDVDHRKKSDRPEIINLHYDRLHNPENCYHLELSWINVTSKLVEDAVVAWATQAEKYGLKLIEVPIAEACSISDHEPFRAPSRLPLAFPPPKPTMSALNSNNYFTSTSFTPQAPIKTDPLLYHKALLKKFNFVLDLEAASDFPADVDVSYSWGALDYRYSQFVHRSGVILAQITHDGAFLLLANRLYNTRATAAKDTTGKFDTKKDPGHGSRAPALPPSLSSSGILGINPSPQPSPLVYAATAAASASSDVFGTRAAPSASGMATYTTPEQIFWELEDFCGDRAKLEAFYREVQTSAASASSASTTPLLRKSGSSGGSSVLRPVRDFGVGEQSIPELRLPPSLAPAVAGAAGVGSVSRFGRRVVSPNYADAQGRESPWRRPVE